jgi:uncharacterized protein YuzE
MSGCKNQAEYETITKTQYVTQKPNGWCKAHAKQWVKDGLSVHGQIMGIEFVTTSKKL